MIHSTIRMLAIRMLNTAEGHGDWHFLHRSHRGGEMRHFQLALRRALFLRGLGRGLEPLDITMMEVVTAQSCANEINEANLQWIKHSFEVEVS